MIGNDLVCFGTYHRQDRVRLARKISKTLTSKELELIDETNPYFCYDVIWSIKEAAYKAMQRSHGFLMKLNPFDFEIENACRTSSFWISQVVYKRQIIQVYSIINSHFVYSFVGENTIHYFNFSINIPHHIRAFISLSINQPTYSKESQLPFVQLDNQLIPLSVTKQDEQVAFCWLAKN